jgi:hypothetical protein
VADPLHLKQPLVVEVADERDVVDGRVGFERLLDRLSGGAADPQQGLDLLPRLKTRESHHGISGRAWPYGFKTHTFQASLA